MSVYALTAIVSVIVVVLLTVFGWVLKISNKTTKHESQIKEIHQALDRINALGLEGSLAEIKTELSFIRAILERGEEK